ncbi:MAG: hypothetical protein V3T24_02130, partial [Longimicrobiales bacterium]
LRQLLHWSPHMSLAGPFLFDPRAFWEDEDVQLLSWEGVGVYLRLLSRQWEEGSIPRDMRRLRNGLAGGERAVVSEELIFEILSLFFAELGEDRYQNRRLAAERVAWVKKKKALSKAGRKGGLKSVKARLEPGLSLAKGSFKRGSSSTSSSSISSSISFPPPGPGKEEERETKASPSRSPDGERARVPSKAELDFAEWWTLMPPKAKTGKAKALKAWCRLPADQRDPAPVVAFLDFLRETQAEVYVKEGGQYLPHGAAFVNSRPWDDDRESYPREEPGGRRGHRNDGNPGGVGGCRPDNEDPMEIPF